MEGFGRPSSNTAEKKLMILLARLRSEGSIDDLVKNFHVSAGSIVKAYIEAGHFLSLAFRGSRYYPRLPTIEQCAELADLLRGKFDPALGRIIGFMDGCKLQITAAAGETLSRRWYSGKDKMPCSSNLFFTLTNGQIGACVMHAPGSFHDSRVAHPILKSLAALLGPYNQGRPQKEKFVVIADSAFPCTDEFSFILKPFRDDEMRAHEGRMAQGYAVTELNCVRYAYGDEIVRARQPAEWTNKDIRGVFSVLPRFSRWYHPNNRRLLFELMPSLVNMRVCFGLPNQVATTYGGHDHEY